MRLIYEDIANKANLTSDRVFKYRKWIEEAEKARKNNKRFDAKENQYDKAEELITFYTFAPLALDRIPNEVKNKIVKDILEFMDIDEPVREVKLYFEKDLPPLKKYLKWLSEEIEKHPIRYIREEAKTKKLLEGHTQIDAVIKTSNLLILFEVKFTSDVSPYTKFGLVRNQIARIIDVGIDVAKNRDNRKLVVVLSAPENLFQKRARLYYYKIQEYSETLNIQKDIHWREINEINETLLKVTWISLERIIETVYRKAKEFLDTNELNEVKDFFKERMLLEV